MTTHRHATILAGLLLGGLLMLPAAAGHGGTIHLTLTAQEGDDCADDENFCYEVTSGDPADITGGATLELTLENPSSNGVQHNAHVADRDDADEGGSTDASQAFGKTDTVSPDGNDTATFDVPSDVSDVYIWCTIGAHEQGGMWLATGSASENGGSGTDGGNGSPGFTALGALGAAGAALVLAQGRRD